jgi:phosphonate ABC transporter permease subunit PhnE
MKNKRSGWASLRLGLAILVGLVIYAYGFQVTQVSFTEIRSERRQESLTRVLRALARPDFIEYEQTEIAVEAPVYVPCPAGGFTPPEPDKSGPYLVVTPACAEPRTPVQVEGFNFAPGTRGPLNFIPGSQVSLRLGDIAADADGHFTVAVRLPARPDDQQQIIRAVTRTAVGSPKLTQTARDTWDKIVETVFLALLATTFGVILAIPVSFLAARNLMKDITSSVSGLALSILAWPIGIWLGLQAAHLIGRLGAPLTTSIPLALASLIVAVAAALFLVRWALPQEEDLQPTLGVRLAHWGALALGGALFLLSLFLGAYFAVSAGNLLAARLGGAGFLGSFVANLGEILNVLISTLAAVGLGGVVSSIAGRLGKRLYLGLRGGARLGVNLILGALAGAMLFVLIMAGLNWLYQFDNSRTLLLAAIIVGAVLGLVTAFLTRGSDLLPTGLIVYYITRTILNALRAIEALIMAIVFVVWVGIGPFAGVLALSLHTIAALAKLYSEQVESIADGPLEAIKATGATRLQTVIYAVIPQIVPPYISFTMYRWDINVRMSTIIGFAGGGGIGFLLIQNINLLNYRAASAQMVAIAIVVALMDFLSSYMREKVV